MGGKLCNQGGSFLTFMYQLRDCTLLGLKMFCDQIEAKLAQNANGIVIFLKNIRK